LHCTREIRSNCFSSIAPAIRLFSSPFSLGAIVAISLTTPLRRPSVRPSRCGERWCDTPAGAGALELFYIYFAGYLPVQLAVFAGRHRCNILDTAAALPR
jgi:hypothetical protein